VHHLSKCLLVLEENGGGGVAELIASIEAGDLEDEQVAHDVTLELADEVGGGLGGTTSGNDVVNNQDVLTLGDGILLHLEEIGTVLLEVLGGDARSGQLALLADGSEADAEAQGQAGAEKEAAGVEADNDIGLGGTGGGKGLGDLQDKGVKEGGVGDGIGEEGHDVDKVDAGDGEVLEVAEALAQAYLCTGELGGGGGGGGGLSSRGILSGGGGVVVGGNLRGAHCEGKGKEEGKEGGRRAGGIGGGWMNKARPGKVLGKEGKTTTERAWRGGVCERE
jgi:hypothetical protein